MTAATEALWLRALRAARARGLVPNGASPLTPRELAAEAARRGEGRLARLVDDWYYPASYGLVRGSLSDDDAGRLVVELEAQTAATAVAETASAADAPAEPAAEKTPARAETDCALCGFPVT